MSLMAQDLRSVLRFGARGRRNSRRRFTLAGFSDGCYTAWPDGSGKCDLFLSFSPSVSFRQHPSEVHARAAYGSSIFTGGQDSALTYPPKLQKRLMILPNCSSPFSLQSRSVTPYGNGQPTIAAISVNLPLFFSLS